LFLKRPIFGGLNVNNKYIFFHLYLYVPDWNVSYLVSLNHSHYLYLPLLPLNFPLLLHPSSRNQYNILQDCFDTFWHPKWRIIWYCFDVNTFDFFRSFCHSLPSLSLSFCLSACLSVSLSLFLSLFTFLSLSLFSYTLTISLSHSLTLSLSLYPQMFFFCLSLWHYCNFSLFLFICLSFSLPYKVKGKHVFEIILEVITFTYNLRHKTQMRFEVIYYKICNKSKEKHTQVKFLHSYDIFLSRLNILKNYVNFIQRFNGFSPFRRKRKP